MPVIGKRRLLRVGEGSYAITVPKEWAEFFTLQGGEDLEQVVDTPVVVFPPQVKNRRDQIEALEKIIKLIEASPERPKEGEK